VLVQAFLEAMRRWLTANGLELPAQIVMMWLPLCSRPYFVEAVMVVEEDAPTTKIVRCKSVFLTIPISLFSPSCPPPLFFSRPLTQMNVSIMQEEEEDFITSGDWRGKHNSLSRGAGADQP
jgi:hypothetical protein